MESKCQRVVSWFWCKSPFQCDLSYIKKYNDREPFSIEAFRNSVCLMQFKRDKQCENIIAMLRNCRLWMIVMKYLSTLVLRLWSENPCTPACSTCTVGNCTNNKWYTGSRDFCRQIVPAILAILHGFILKRVKHIREVLHVKIKTDDNRGHAKVNIANLGFKMRNNVY